MKLLLLYFLLNIFVPVYAQEEENNNDSILEIMENKNHPEQDCIIHPFMKTTKELAENFLLRLNNLFNTKVHFNFISKVSPFYFSTDSYEQTISFPNSYLNEVCTGKTTLNEMYFILSHEYSHTLIETNNPDVENSVTNWIMKFMNNNSEAFESQISELSHINTDTIAAKILKHFEIPIQDGIKWIESFKVIFPKIKKLYPYWNRRALELQKAYDEGPDGWSNIFKIYPLCNSSKLSVLFKNDNYSEDIKNEEDNIKFVKRLKNEVPKFPTNCIFYSEKDVLKALDQW